MTWIGLGFAVGILFSSFGLLIDFTRIKIVIGFGLAFLGSLLMFGQMPLLIVAFMFCVSGFGLAADATYDALILISRNMFENWRDIWSMKCLGLGIGAVWGTISVNILHPALALVPYQLALIVFSFYCYKNWREVVPHEHFALDAQEHAVRESLLNRSRV